MTATAAPKSTTHMSIIGSVCNQLLLVIQFMLFAWLFALIIGVAYYFYHGNAVSLNFFIQTINQQLNVLDQSANVVVLFASHKLLDVINYLQRELAGFSGVHISFLGSNGLFATLLKVSLSVINILLLATLTIGLKLLVVINYIPAIMLCLSAAIIDGLVLREVRRYCNARESAMVYTQWRRLFKPILLIGIGAYLIVPYDINPSQIIVPTLLLASVTLFLMVKTYKKYF